MHTELALEFFEQMDRWMTEDLRTSLLLQKSISELKITAIIGLITLTLT